MNPVVLMETCLGNVKLGYGYAVFGKVIEGMEVVDKIAAVKTSTQRGLRDVPETPIVIKSMKVLP